jgi:2-polyprenyl-3-methyl-5-hydroxy-6-metoxy-1,4-benzoquinol methylase
MPDHSLVCVNVVSYALGMSLYSLQVELLKNPTFNGWWRRWSVFRRRKVGSYADLGRLVAQHCAGKTFADVGCMWGVDGEHSFGAERAGATRVLAIDVFGPTPEFVHKKEHLDSQVEFILGDIGESSTIDRVGRNEVVLCAGVLYHHPSPYDLLVALRRICDGTLILRTSTIPENRSLPNAAVYYPLLNERERRRWDLRTLGVLHQEGITNAFAPHEGYGNWFWGMSPSALRSLVETAGFRVVETFPEPFAQTLICTVSEAPFAHRLPSESEGRAMGAAVENAGIARPA